MSGPVRTLLISAAILMALAACKKPEAGAPPPPEVGVLKADAVSVPLERDLVGRLSPYRSSDVRARVPGVLLKRLYAEGSDVKEGQALFQIDPAPLQASLSAAQANLASAQATYTNAKVAADRARKLAPQQYVSQSDLDTAEAAERSAAAAVQQAQANVTSARINLGYANVVAPIPGRAGKQQVTEGALVGQSEATLLTTVDQIDPIYVNFSLSVTELESLRKAQKQGNVALADQDDTKVEIELEDGVTYDKAGTLDFSDVVADPATGSLSLRAVVPNPDHVLMPGMFVTIKATMGEQHDAFLIPQQAIQRDAIGSYALVAGSDGKVVRKNVTTVRAQAGKWLISEGLAAGDQVIVSGLQKTREGGQVKPAPWKPEAAAGSTTGKPAQAPAKQG